MPGDAAKAASPKFADATPIYRRVTPVDRIFQGEIIENVSEWVPRYSAANPDEVTEASRRLRRLAVVLTQDCDLAQDWTLRATNPHLVTDLPCVLLCPVDGAEARFDAEQIVGSDRRKPIRNNKNERYQYLAEVPPELDGIESGHSALLVDFKSLFTIPTVEIYRQVRVAGAESTRRRFRLETPWAEHLQCRFASYHCRIGLPRDHFVPPGRRTEGA